MHLCQRFFQSSKHLLNLISGIALKAFFDSVWGIARSHTEPNQAGIAERYALRFWRNGHEERVQCETAHYRDAKTTSFLLKISFETVLSEPLEIPIVSAKSLIVNRRFLCTNSLI